MSVVTSAAVFLACLVVAQSNPQKDKIERLSGKEVDGVEVVKSLEVNIPETVESNRGSRSPDNASASGYEYSSPQGNGLGYPQPGGPPYRRPNNQQQPPDCQQQFSQEPGYQEGGYQQGGYQQQNFEQPNNFQQPDLQQPEYQQGQPGQTSFFQGFQQDINLRCSCQCSPAPGFGGIAGGPVGFAAPAAARGGSGRPEHLTKK
ncbi:uncharacterized protein [Periplaneta americana]|uniref:uncharacterized protein n=1 Tax=Periplaneta americana TaxID=6978 RepID=UPI0037E995F4